MSSRYELPDAAWGTRALWCRRFDGLEMDGENGRRGAAERKYAQVKAFCDDKICKVCSTHDQQHLYPGWSSANALMRRVASKWRGRGVITPGETRGRQVRQPALIPPQQRVRRT